MCVSIGQTYKRCGCGGTVVIYGVFKKTVEKSLIYNVREPSVSKLQIPRIKFDSLRFSSD